MQQEDHRQLATCTMNKEKEEVTEEMEVGCILVTSELKPIFPFTMATDIKVKAGCRFMLKWRENYGFTTDR